MNSEKRFDHLTHHLLWLFSLLCVAETAIVLNAQSTKPANPTGLFGRLEFHKESGDVTGLEVFVVKGRSGYVAVVQIAEGVPADPVVVPITLDGAILSFEVLAGKTRLRYQGTVRADGLYGKFDNGAFSERDDGLFVLIRGRSYWQQ
jgi:hypothetical protein